jgi:nicotinate-nucleotide adenylyltransferase
VATRIGIFGGTFDPVHTAHLQAAEAVRTRLGLDRMLLVVANEPWQKVGERPLTPAEDRYAMVVAAVAGWPGLEPSRLEIDRGGPSYTVDTVRDLLQAEPGAEVTLVVGSDVVAGLPTWKEEATLADLVTLAVVGRPGVDPVAPPPGWSAVHVAVGPFEGSSTDLRQRLEAGQPVDTWIPEAVVRCIAQRGLYATGR